MDNRVETILLKLSKSKFRSRFHLKTSDIAYIDKKGLSTIESHAYDFLNKRIRIKQPNDGKQTPMRGHPVFIAEHATATCCRGCIAKWYKIPEDKVLNDEEIDFLVQVIMTWIKREYNIQKKC